MIKKRFNIPIISALIMSASCAFASSIYESSELNGKEVFVSNASDLIQAYRQGEKVNCSFASDLKSEVALNIANYAQIKGYPSKSCLNEMRDWKKSFCDTFKTNELSKFKEYSSSEKFFLRNACDQEKEYEEFGVYENGHLTFKNGLVSIEKDNIYSFINPRYIQKIDFKPSYFVDYAVVEFYVNDFSSSFVHLISLVKDQNGVSEYEVFFDHVIKEINKGN